GQGRSPPAPRSDFLPPRSALQQEPQATRGAPKQAPPAVPSYGPDRRFNICGALYVNARPDIEVPPVPWTTALLRGQRPPPNRRAGPEATQPTHGSPSELS